MDPKRTDWNENCKVIYHPKWLRRWRKDPFSVPPIYVEISPAGACNHRCTFCAPEVLNYRPNYLPLDVYAKCFDDMRRIREEDPDGLGFHSIQVAGEGEPVLHHDLPEICRLIRSAGMDLGILTNGVLMRENILDRVVPLVNGYLQVSINAGKPETYSKIHRTKIRDWDLVWKNIDSAVAIKQKLGAAECDIGINMTLLVKETMEPDGSIVPANWQEMEELVKKAKDSGIDYISIKPYSQDHYSKETARRYGDMKYGDLLEEIFGIAKRLVEQYSSQGFEVVFRFSRFEEYEQAVREYPICLSTPTLWAYIQSDGTVLSCSQWTNPEFVLGNINTESIKDIWFGERRRRHFDFVNNVLDISKVCRITCHPDKENLFLYRIQSLSDEEFEKLISELEKRPPVKRKNFI